MSGLRSLDVGKVVKIVGIAGCLSMIGGIILPYYQVHFSDGEQTVKLIQSFVCIWVLLFSIGGMICIGTGNWTKLSICGLGGIVFWIDLARNKDKLLSKSVYQNISVDTKIGPWLLFLGSVALIVIGLVGYYKVEKR